MSLRTFVLIAVAIGALGALAFLMTRAPEVALEGASGPDHYVAEFFYAGLGYGSECFATSTTGTLSASTLDKNGCIRIAASGAGQGALTITLPATTTMSGVLPKTGTCRDWWIDASAVAAATTTTLVAGSGWNLVGLDATGAGTGADVIDGAEYGRLTACRENDGDVTGFLQEWIAAD